MLVHFSHVLLDNVQLRTLKLMNGNAKRFVKPNYLQTETNQVERFQMEIWFGPSILISPKLFS